MDKQKVFNLALKIFLFLSPVFFFSAYQLSMARGMFFLFGSFALFGISLFKEPKRQFSNMWVALIFLAALLRVFVGNEFGNVASVWFNFWLSAGGFIYVLAGILLFKTVYCHAEDIRQYLKPILAVCMLNLILVIAQLTGHDFMWTNSLSIAGFMSTPSQLGQYSALSVPLLYIINPFLVIIPLITLFISKSVSSILAIFVGSIVFLALVGRNKKIIALVVILGIGLLALNYGYIAAKWQCRPIMWERTLKVALQRPFLGHGYRSFDEQVLRVESKGNLGSVEYSRPHSDPLHTAQSLGFPIVIFFAGLFISMWKKLKGKTDILTVLLATSVIIVLVNGCGQTLLRYAEIAGTATVLLALLSVRLEEGK